MPKAAKKSSSKTSDKAVTKAVRAAASKKEPAVQAPVKPAASKAAPKTPVSKVPAPKASPKPAALVKTPAPRTARTGNYYYANGKRKTSVSTVRMYANGKGEITINERTFENYFTLFLDQDKILAPLRLTNTLKTFDITVQVQGGGVHSQAEAVRHGIAKALLAYDVALRSILKPVGFLTRDSRVKERKKYGLHRARRGPQFSKR